MSRPWPQDGYRVVVLYGERWFEVGKDLTIAAAEVRAGLIDVGVLAGPRRGWAILAADGRCHSADTPKDWPPPELVEHEGFDVKVERGACGSWYASAGRFNVDRDTWWPASACRVGKTRDEALLAAVAEARTLESRR